MTVVIAQIGAPNDGRKSVTCCAEYHPKRVDSYQALLPSRVCLVDESTLDGLVGASFLGRDDAKSLAYMPTHFLLFLSQL